MCIIMITQSLPNNAKPRSVLSSTFSLVNNLTVGIISKIYFCYIVFLIGVCYQNYENYTSSATISSYMLSVQSSGEVAVVTEYSDTACTTYFGNLTYSIGDCLQTGDTSYMSLSISVVSNPVLLPGMYYVGYQSQADCESMIDRPASYVVKYPTDQCTPVSDGVYFDGLCQANGNLSYSIYTDPACSGTAIYGGNTSLPGPPNHGCVSRLSLGEDIESSDTSSEWVRFYCGTNQAFPGMDSPTPLPAVVPTWKPQRSPTTAPSFQPVSTYSSQPNTAYSPQPSTAYSSHPDAFTLQPNTAFSPQPIAAPLCRPSWKPSSRPIAPSLAPSKKPKKTAEPTAFPTKKTRRPSALPTETPTKRPRKRSAAPTAKPTKRGKN